MILKDHERDWMREWLDKSALEKDCQPESGENCKPLSFEELMIKSKFSIAEPDLVIDDFKKNGIYNFDEALKQILLITNLEARKNICKSNDAVYKDYQIKATGVVNSVLSKKEFLKIYKHVHFQELNPNWVADNKAFKFNSNLAEIVRILSNELVLPKEDQFELLKYVYEGYTAAELALRFPKSQFCNLNERDRRKLMSQARLLIIKERNPLLVMGAIYLGKDTRYSTSEIRPNDVPLETGLVYRHFISKIDNGLVNAEEIVIIGGTPFFILKIASDERLKNVPITFVLRNEYEKAIASIHFTNANYSGNIRMDYTFRTVNEFYDTLLTHPFRYQKGVLFANTTDKFKAGAIIDSFFETSKETDELLVVSSDDFFEKKCLNMLSKSVGIDEVLIIPTGIINSGAPKKKVLFSIRHLKGDEKDIFVTKGILATTEDGTQLIRTSSQFVSLKREDLKVPGKTLREFYDDQSDSCIKSRKRNGSSYIMFSNEIKIQFSCIKIKERYRVEASIPEPKFDFEKEEFVYQNRVPSSMKRVSNLPFEKIEDWILGEYPFSQLVNSRTGTFIDIKSVISEMYKRVYLNNEDTFIPLSFRTLWYVFENEFTFVSPKELTILRELAMGEIGNLDLQTASAEDIADALSATGPVSNPMELARKLNLISNLINFAVQKKLCGENVIEIEFKMNRAKSDVFSVLRTHFAKKTFSKEEMIDLKRVIMGRLDSDMPQYISLLIKLYTGLENNVICALTWDDFEMIQAFGLGPVFKFNLYRQVTNDGMTIVEFEDETEIRDYPINSELASILIEMRNKVKSNFPHDFQKRHIVPCEEDAEFMTAFSPKKVGNLCRELLNRIGVDEDLIFVPQADGGTKEMNLNRYQGDIFKSNFQFYAKKIAGMSVDEINFLIGKKPVSTIAKSYLCLMDDRMQSILYFKQERINHFLHEEAKCFKKENCSVAVGKLYRVLPLNRTPLICNLKITVPANHHITVRISNKLGFASRVYREVNGYDEK